MISDVYVPSLKLMFEYNGYQHYHDHALFGTVKSQGEKDDEKRVACEALGIRVIEIPYWWQHDKESLRAILNKYVVDNAFPANVIPFVYQIKN